MKTNLRTTFLVWCVVLLGASSAVADVGAVIVTGTIKPRQREIVETAAIDALRASSWSFVEPALSASERDAVIGCTEIDRPWACVARATQGKSLDRVALIDVRPDKSANDQLAITVQLLAAGNGVPTTEGRHCAKPCSDDTLRASTTEVVSMTASTAAARNPTATLEIRSRPEGAVITLDGQLVGQTNKTISTTPGRHTVLLQRDGFEPATRTIAVEEGKTEVVDVPLVATSIVPGKPDQPPIEVPPPRPSRLWPLLTIGVGAAGLVGGTVYSLTRSSPDGPDQPKYLYSGAGIGVAIGGGVVATIGVIWFLRSSRDDSRPTVSITSSGTTVGWTGSF